MSGVNEHVVSSSSMSISQRERKLRMSAVFGALMSYRTHALLSTVASRVAASKSHVSRSVRDSIGLLRRDFWTSAEGRLCFSSVRRDLTELRNALCDAVAFATVAMGNRDVARLLNVREVGARRLSRLVDNFVVDGRNAWAERHVCVVHVSDPNGAMGLTFVCNADRASVERWHTRLSKLVSSGSGNERLYKLMGLPAPRRTALKSIDDESTRSKRWIVELHLYARPETRVRRLFDLGCVERYVCTHIHGPTAERVRRATEDAARKYVHDDLRIRIEIHEERE